MPARSPNTSVPATPEEKAYDESAVILDTGSVKVNEVKQGSVDLIEHAMQFQQRMVMLRVPQLKVVGLFEASLNAESRSLFWHVDGSKKSDVRSLSETCCLLQDREVSRVPFSNS